jgi:RNA polymerase sigma-32 factor
MAQSWNQQNYGDNAKLIRAAMKAPMLEKKHELDLARRWRENGDEKALAELTQSYLRLVIALAGKFKNYGLPLNDLVQEGCVGLMEAASRFEVERNIRFSTYSSWWIRSSMQDFILRNWSIVRTGTTAAHKTLFFNMRRIRAQLGRDLDGPLTQNTKEYVATELGVKMRDVNIMEARLMIGDQSLNATMGENHDTEWQEMLPSEDATPEDNVMKWRDTKVRHNVLVRAMKALTKRENTIIRERRLRDKCMTLADLGVRLGISKERVRQLESQALGKLKEAIVKETGDPHISGIGLN